MAETAPSGRLTYGPLIERARRAAAFAAGLPPAWPPTLAQLTQEAAGLSRLVEVLDRHVRFLADGVDGSHPIWLLAGELRRTQRALADLPTRDEAAAAASLWDGPHRTPRHRT